MFVMPRADYDDEYYDRWVRTYSEVTNTNLCTYFDWFKIKITDETYSFCQTLPNGMLFIAGLPDFSM
jgi:hypothetical protein